MCCGIQKRKKKALDFIDGIQKYSGHSTLTRKTNLEKYQENGDLQTCKISGVKRNHIIYISYRIILSALLVHKILKYEYMIQHIFTHHVLIFFKYPNQHQDHYFYHYQMNPNFERILYYDHMVLYYKILLYFVEYELFFDLPQLYAALLHLKIYC